MWVYPIKLEIRKEVRGSQVMILKETESILSFTSASGIPQEADGIGIFNLQAFASGNRL